MKVDAEGEVGAAVKDEVEGQRQRERELGVKRELPGESVEREFDHERLHVYQRAREFYLLAVKVLRKALPSELRDQFERASTSILFNIGEGAGKTARKDKQRAYEIARGSSTEVATQMDVFRMRGFISEEEYRNLRAPLVEVCRMLSRLCGPFR